MATRRRTARPATRPGSATDPRPKAEAGPLAGPDAGPDAGPVARPVAGPVAGPGGDGDLGWALGVLFRRYVKAVDAVIGDIPGGPRGYQVLALAARTTDGVEAIGQRAIGERLGIDRTVLTYLIDDLEDLGLVERRPDPSDRRGRLIFATPKGADVCARRCAALRHVERHLLAGLGDEAPHFRDLLFRLATEAQSHDPVNDTCQAVEELTRPTHTPTPHPSTSRTPR